MANNINNYEIKISNFSLKWSIFAQNFIDIYEKSFVVRQRPASKRGNLWFLEMGGFWYPNRRKN